MTDSVPGYFKYWGKADPSYEGEPKWHPLVYHCLDVAAVGYALLMQKENIRHRFAEITHLDDITSRHWLTLFLGLHDIGKFSESFQNLRPDLLEKLQCKKSSMAYSVRHDSLGNLLWVDLLWASFEASTSSRQPDFEQFREFWQEIFACLAKAHTGHHGEPPRMTGPNDLRLTLSGYFSPVEAKASEDFFIDFEAVLFLEHGVTRNLPSPMEIFEFIPIASWLIAGFTVLCDWIGSNSQWFPFWENAMPLADYWQRHAVPQAKRAIRESGISAASPRTSGNTFNDLFPEISEPTPLQRHVTDCLLAGSPQLFVLEDVTGSGKTEAAIVLAQRLIARGLGDGTFIALPTMATSNAMYERVAKVYRKLFTEDSSPSLVLAHGARHLSDAFMRSITVGHDMQRPYRNDDDTAAVQCTAWLADNRKKALLADVGVGTLDQSLLAILPSRFQSLRLYGLAGHILIVDEVHSYDPYMNKLLQTLLSFHAALGGSAILLSATLPLHVRQELVTSFAHGIGMPFVPQVGCAAYPLATHLYRDGGISEISVGATAQRRTSIPVKIISEQDAVERVIIKTSEQGRCVCWIRNTVHDALDGYESLRKKIDADRMMLFHARFAMGDRLSIENCVCASFGKKSQEQNRCGRVLIATQVVEQSLDLDFDLLVSDLAPMDLLIQRAGRLHRHLRDERGNPLPFGAGPDRRETPCFIIHSPLPENGAGADWYSAAFPKAAFVYPSHGCLWLTAWLLRDKGFLNIPDDARKLIEAAFSNEADSLIPVPLRERDMEAEAEWQADRSLAHINMLKLEEGYSATANQWREDMRTPTRLGEMETTVRLARWDGITLTPWCSHPDFPWDMSQVGLRSAVVHSEADHAGRALKLEIGDLKARLPDKGKWSVLVPLMLDAGGKWRGDALDKNGKPVRVSYDPVTGVTVTKKE